MRRRTLILGRGFGLYGYLPAVLATPDAVALLPLASERAFAARAELLQFRERVEFLRDDRLADSGVTRCIVAKRPDQQLLSVKELPVTVTELLLEKPIASSAGQADEVMNWVPQRVQLRVGYTFLYTPWFRALSRELSDLLQADTRIHLNWRFRAHHFRHSLMGWKRLHSAGGGVLRFYGIHVLAALSALRLHGSPADWRPMSSVLEARAPDEPHAWRAEFESAEGLRASIVVESDAPSNHFSVISGAGAANTSVHADQLDPFGHTGAPQQPNQADARVAMLTDMLLSFDDPVAHSRAHAAQTNRLWAEVERLSQWTT